MYRSAGFPLVFQQFLEYPQIRKHIRAFHGLKRFKCDLCDKSFSSADKLKQHHVT